MNTTKLNLNTAEKSISRAFAATLAIVAVMLALLAGLTYANTTPVADAPAPATATAENVDAEFGFPI